MKKNYILPIIIVTITVLINAFIIMHSCFNANVSSSSSGRLVNFLKAIINFFHANTINDNNIGSFTHVIRKLVGHFGLFVFSGFFTSFSFTFVIKKEPFYKDVYFFLLTLTVGIFIAFLTEFIQRFVPGRSGEFVDAMIDFSGYILGTIILKILLMVISLVKTKNDKKRIQG